MGGGGDDGGGEFGGGSSHGTGVGGGGGENSMGGGGEEGGGDAEGGGGEGDGGGGEGEGGGGREREMALVRRAAWPMQLLLWRSLTTATASPTTATAGAASASAVATSPAKRHRRKKNLVDVIKFLPGWGIGAKLAKTHWIPNTFYKITDVKLNKDAAHGAAWGIYHESGLPLTGKIEKLGGANKRCWKYINDVETKVWKSL